MYIEEDTDLSIIQQPGVSWQSRDGATNKHLLCNEARLIVAVSNNLVSVKDAFERRLGCQPFCHSLQAKRCSGAGCVPCAVLRGCM